LLNGVSSIEKPHPEGVEIIWVTLAASKNRWQVVKGLLIAKEKVKSLEQDCLAGVVFTREQVDPCQRIYSHLAKEPEVFDENRS
jgi:hypothetical protein